MFGLKIFVRVQTFRRVPPVLPRNFCHPDKDKDKQQTSQKLLMLSSPLSDWHSPTLNVMIRVAQFVRNSQLCHYYSLNHSQCLCLCICLCQWRGQWHWWCQICQISRDFVFYDCFLVTLLKVTNHKIDESGWRWKAFAILAMFKSYQSLLGTRAMDAIASKKRITYFPSQRCSATLPHLSYSAASDLSFFGRRRSEVADLAELPWPALSHTWHILSPFQTSWDSYSVWSTKKENWGAVKCKLGYLTAVVLSWLLFKIC